MSDQVVIRIKIVDGQPTAAGLIGVSHAAEILGCAPNTVRSRALKGDIGFFWINYGHPSALMLFYRVDVISLKKEKSKKSNDKNV